jgi:hypothetical protein
MSRTIVQLRERRPSARLVYGTPEAMADGATGPLATFAPGALVGYRIESSYRHSLFLFRSLLVDDPLAAAVLGVRPRVQLLLELHTRESIRRAGRLLGHLLASGWSPDHLSDAFWGRVSSALRGRMPAQASLVSLLRFERRIALPSPTAPRAFP